MIEKINKLFDMASGLLAIYRCDICMKEIDRYSMREKKGNKVYYYCDTCTDKILEERKLDIKELPTKG